MFYIALPDYADTSDIFTDAQALITALDLGGDCSYDTVLVFASSGCKIATIHKQYKCAAIVDIISDVLLANNEAIVAIVDAFNLRVED